MIPKLEAPPEGYRWELDLDLKRLRTEVTLRPNALGRAFRFKTRSVHLGLNPGTSRAQAFDQACRIAHYMMEIEREVERVERTLGVWGWRRP